MGLRRLLGCLAGPASHNGVDQYLYYPEFRPAVLTISVATRCRACLAVKRPPDETGIVHATSALFDLYGDHLRSRGSRAPVAALVRLLAQGVLTVSVADRLPLEQAAAALAQARHGAHGSAIVLRTGDPG